MHTSTALEEPSRDIIFGGWYYYCRLREIAAGCSPFSSFCAGDTPYTGTCNGQRGFAPLGRGDGGLSLQSTQGDYGLGSCVRSHCAGLTSRYYTQRQRLLSGEPPGCGPCNCALCPLLVAWSKAFPRGPGSIEEWLLGWQTASGRKMKGPRGRAEIDSLLALG